MYWSELWQRSDGVFKNGVLNEPKGNLFRSLHGALRRMKLACRGQFLTWELPRALQKFMNCSRSCRLKPSVFLFEMVKPLVLVSDLAV